MKPFLMSEQLKTSLNRRAISVLGYPPDIGKEIHENFFGRKLLSAIVSPPIFSFENIEYRKRIWFNKLYFHRNDLNKSEKNYLVKKYLLKFSKQNIFGVVPINKIQLWKLRRLKKRG